MRIALLWIVLLNALPVAAAPCTARSGERMAALVELYTSEGCSSCPPADRWLSHVARSYSTEQVVPIALHVDYWDYIGWKDPYAKRPFSQRQRTLSQLQRLALVYTPQVLVQGADFRGWATPAFDAAVRRINSGPARARLELEILSISSDRMRVRAAAQLADGAEAPRAALYVAAFEDRLEIRVTAGENEGRLLTHDRVVLEWRGPYAFSGAPRTVQILDLPLLPKAKPPASGVAAFVQDRGSADVLQSLSLAACVS